MLSWLVNIVHYTEWFVGDYELTNSYLTRHQTQPTSISWDWIVVFSHGSDAFCDKKQLNSKNGELWACLNLEPILLRRLRKHHSLIRYMKPAQLYQAWVIFACSLSCWGNTLGSPGTWKSKHLVWVIESISRMVFSSVNTHFSCPTGGWHL